MITRNFLSEFDPGFEQVELEDFLREIKYFALTTTV